VKLPPQDRGVRSPSSVYIVYWYKQIEVNSLTKFDESESEAQACLWVEGLRLAGQIACILVDERPN